MVLAIDVYYYDTYARVVGVLFHWQDNIYKQSIIKKVNSIEPYQSGSFYKRELPCIFEILKEVELSDLEAIIVDGHVYVDNDKKPGLGAYLWNSLETKVPVIGVAKNNFINTDRVCLPLKRGNSNKPLFISSIGMSNAEALDKINNMHGLYRIPTLLKLVDSLSRVGEL